ncbi:MAG: EscU/YscU/HrcU family type III secretion system export apparatus switch protein, partial [Solirubrobacteraceae bacterium]
MAGTADRTEKPTAKRRDEARRKGQVARSTEISNVAVLMAGLAAMMLLGPKVISGTAGAMRAAFALAARPHAVISAAGLHGLLSIGLHVLEATVAPIAGICLAGALLSNVAQVGFRPSMEKLKPDFRKLSPVSGFKSVFGKQILVQLGEVFAKVAVVGAVVAMTLIPQITNVSTTVGTSPSALGSLMSSNAKSIVLRVALAYVLIAIIDLIWQRRRHQKMLKMTKQEVKDEAKSQETPPEVRSAIRRRQLQAARARMMAAVPTADVVVTNPTHYAVALRYDGTLPAPTVVAKGKNLIAAQIRRIATEHDIPI